MIKALGFVGERPDLEADRDDSLYIKAVENLRAAGFAEELDQGIPDRLVLMERGSEFNEDSHRISRGAVNIMKLLSYRFGETNPQLRFSSGDILDVRGAAEVHDIGKTGPADATPEEQEVVLKIFAKEGVNDPNISVYDTAAEIFGDEELEKAIGSLENCGITRQMTMRQFWDKHAFWTRDILEKYNKGINKRVRVIAASHHVDRGINPYNLPMTEIPLSAALLGGMEEYIDVLKERILIAVDQYEANIRRHQPGYASGSAKPSHEEAMKWVRSHLAGFRDDELMNMIFGVMDELGKNQLIFSSADYKQLAA